MTAVVFYHHVSFAVLELDINGITQYAVLCLASLAHRMSVEIHVVSLRSFNWIVALGLSPLGSFPHWGGETKIHLRDQRRKHILDRP